jgi:hypothetical protein
VAAPTEDEDVVVPLRLQSVVDRPSGLRGRSGGIVGFALIGFLVISVVLGRVLEAGPPSRPPAAAIATGSPAASTPPTPRTAVILEPTASPLPSVEVVGGRFPTERRFVYADGLQVLDLATGTLQPTSQPLYDQYLPISRDEVVCACSLNGIFGGDPAIPPSIRFGRYGMTGTVVLQRELLRFEDVVPVQDMTNGMGAVSALSPDRATLYTLVAARRPPSWTIDLYAIDVESGKVVGHASLGRIPVAVEPAAASPSPAASSPPAPPGQPPDGIYAWPNWLAAAPDGQTLHAVIGYQEVRDSVWSSHTREWMVPVHDLRPGRPIRIKSTDSLKPDDWCVDSPAFIDPKLVVQTCAAASPDGSGAAFYVRRLTTGGQSLGNLTIDGAPLSRGYPISTLLDPRSRSIVLWDPVGHVVGRISVDDGTVQTTSVPESMFPDAPGDRDMGPGASPALVQSPDGTKLYTLGLVPAGGEGPSSSGIWVFDSETLALLQHWPARALLTSLAVSADGTFVYAAGAQGFDVDGRQRPWPASVTVYDAETGEIQVVYGAVSSTSWVNFLPVWP